MTHHENHDESQTLCPACEIGPFIRNNYFTGKLMLERDFTDEQRYFIEKIRHHHQRLHGWGVVCGLKVKQHAKPACRDRYICIEPGTAIDCCGHEIVVHEEECIDITQLPSIKALIDKKDVSSHTLQVCLRYRECPSEEIPVLYDECGCDDTKCAPNRILESFDVDILVDSKSEPQTLHSPKLKWEYTVNIAHAMRVGLHNATHRIYVLTADAPGVVYQLSTDNHATITSRNLPAKAFAVAVSNNGQRVYVATEPTAPATVRQLHVLDATKPGLPSINANPIDILDSAGSDVVLAVAPDNHLLAMVATTGDILRWDTGIDSNSAPAAPTLVKKLGINLTTFALSSDGKVAYVAGASDEIQAFEIATQNVTKIKVLPASPKVSELIVVKSTGPDVLAVANQNGNQMHLVAPNPPALIGSVALDHTPVSLATSPGGHWIYVLEQDPVAKESYVQTVNAYGLQQKLPVMASAKFKVGHTSQQLSLNESGAQLYIPFTNDLNNPVGGGVAIIDISEQECEEILWRHLEGCPQCDTPNCVVLATIEHYQIGDKIQDQTDPPADPATDIAAHIARIDNRGRQLLPSTQVLRELIECLMQQGPGGTGTQGPPGAPGEQGLKGDTGEKGDTVVGPAGPGLEKGLVRINALSWKHNKPNALFLVRMENGDERLGIVIAFTQPVVVSSINANYVFQLLVERLPDQDSPESFFRCRCPIAGDIVPVKIGIEADLITSAQVNGESESHGVAFVLDKDTENKILEALKQKIISNVFSVILRGDFVLDRDGRAVDAEFVRAELPTGDRPKDSTFGIQGGTFESWFTVKG